MMNRVVLTGVMLLGLVAGCETLGDLGGRDSDKIANKDNDFFKDAATSDMLEIESSQLALERAQSDQVRDFAKMMIEDHTEARADLRVLASDKDVDLPKQMGSRNRAAVDALRDLDGREFDRAYMQAQVTAHQDTIRRFEAAAEGAKDRDVRRLAEKMLPTLKEHLQMARRISDRVGTSSDRSM